MQRNRPGMDGIKGLEHQQLDLVLMANGHFGLQLMQANCELCNCCDEFNQFLTDLLESQVNTLGVILDEFPNFIIDLRVFQNRNVARPFVLFQCFLHLIL